MGLAVHVDVAGQPGLDSYNLPPGVKSLILGYLQMRGLSPECAYAKDTYSSAAEAVKRGITDARLVAGIALLDAEFKSSIFFLQSSLGPTMLKRLPKTMKGQAGTIAAYVTGPSLVERLAAHLTGRVGSTKRDLLGLLHEWHPDFNRLEADIAAGKFAHVA